MRYLFLFFLLSCSPRISPEQRLQNEMNQFVGMSKETLIKSIGFPSRTEDLEGNPVLIYSALTTSGLGVFARQYYQHKLFFFSGGRVSTWLVQNNELPVEQLNIRILERPRIN